MRRAATWALAAVLAAGALAAASVSCGSDDATPLVAADATDDGTARDATLDVADAEPACDPRADLFAKVRDASIGDGASTTGLCLVCAKRQCPDAIRKCTEHCPCQGIVGRAADCYLTTLKLGCAGELTSILVTQETRADALAVLGCVQEQCAAECAIDAGAGSDAGDDAAPDGGR